MTGADTLAECFRRGRAQAGRLRLALYLAVVALLLAKIAIYFVVDEPNRIINFLAAIVVTIWSAERFLDQPKPDRLWGFVLAVGAAVLWAQVFGLVPYPLGMF